MGVLQIVKNFQGCLNDLVSKLKTLKCLKAIAEFHFNAPAIFVFILKNDASSSERKVALARDIVFGK